MFRSISAMESCIWQSQTLAAEEVCLIKGHFGAQFKKEKKKTQRVSRNEFQKEVLLFWNVCIRGGKFLSTEMLYGCLQYMAWKASEINKLIKK